MSTASFKQIQAYNSTLLAAREDSGTYFGFKSKEIENSLCEIFEKIRWDFMVLTSSLPEKVSNESDRQASEKIYKKLQEFAYCLDPEIPGYNILYQLITTPPVEIKEEESTAVFTERQKNTIYYTNQMVTKHFLSFWKNPFYSKKAVKNPRHGLPILTRMRTLVNKLPTSPLIDDKTCAKTLKTYECIREHYATSYPGCENALPGGRFDHMIEILPTNQEELDTFAQECATKSKFIELHKKIHLLTGRLEKLPGISKVHQDGPSVVPDCLSVPLVLTRNMQMAFHSVYCDIEVWATGVRKKLETDVPEELAQGPTEESPLDLLKEIEELLEQLLKTDEEPGGLYLKPKD